MAGRRMSNEEVEMAERVPKAAEHPDGCIAEPKMKATWHSVGIIVDEAVEFLAKRFKEMNIRLGQEDKDELAEALYAGVHDQPFAKRIEGEPYSD